MAEWDDVEYYRHPDHATGSDPNLVKAQGHWKNSVDLAQRAEKIEARHGGATRESDRLHAKATSERAKALALGWTSEFQGKVPGLDRRGGTRSRGTDVGQTGGPPTSGPTKGNGRFF